MKLKKMMEKYKSAVKFAGIKIPPRVLLSLTLIGVVVGFVIGLLFDFTLAILLVFLALDIGLGLPFFLAEKKVAEIETRLPDVLHHIGTTLKTGGTIETALREVSRINYGPITDGTREMLRQINEGKTFEEAFSDFAVKSRSELLKKAAIIIIAAKKSGGALLETLTAMAEDFRALYRLDRERKTKTFMQFLFILTAGCFVAPFVFGIVRSVLSILVQVGGETLPSTMRMVAEFDTLFKAYLIVESTLSVIGAVQVREGKLSKAVVYIPIGIVISYVIYIVVAASFLSFLTAAT